MDFRKEVVYLTKTGEPKTESELVPNNQVVYSLDGTPFPPELMNKTIKELRQMGFTDVAKINMKFDNATNGLKPQMDPIERHKL